MVRLIGYDFLAIRPPQLKKLVLGYINLIGVYYYLGAKKPKKP